MLRKKITYWLAIVLFSVAAVWWAKILARQYLERQKRALATRVLTTPPREYGSKSAKVNIVAVFPMGTQCHQNARRILVKLAKEEPERVHVVLADLHSEAGHKLGRSGCAEVLINGKDSFKVERGERTVDVIFHEAPDGPGCAYYSTDLIRAAHEELKQQYGSGLDPDGVLAQLDDFDRDVAAGLPGPGDYPEAVENYGPEDAPVTVAAYLPLVQAGSSAFLAAAERLRNISRELDERVRLIIVKVDTPEGRERVLADRVQPPAVLVNGSATHRVTVNGKETEVTFYGGRGLPTSPDDSSSELEAVIRAAVAEAASEPADEQQKEPQVPEGAA